MENSENATDKGQIPNKNTMTPEQLHRALVVDLDCAIYFLHALREHPEIIKDIASKMHETHMKTGPLIDSFQKSE